VKALFPLSINESCFRLNSWLIYLIKIAKI
jgi:hypothetical protein